MFPDLVSQLEKPTDVNALPTVKASVVQEAGIPTRPSSAGHGYMLGLGLISGLLVGVLYANVRNALRPALSEPAGTDVAGAGHPVADQTAAGASAANTTGNGRGPTAPVQWPAIPNTNAPAPPATYVTPRYAHAPYGPVPSSGPDPEGRPYAEGHVLQPVRNGAPSNGAVPRGYPGRPVTMPDFAQRTPPPAPPRPVPAPERIVPTGREPAEPTSGRAPMAETVSGDAPTSGTGSDVTAAPPTIPASAGLTAEKVDEMLAGKGAAWNAGEDAAEAAMDDAADEQDANEADLDPDDGVSGARGVSEVGDEADDDEADFSTGFVSTNGTSSVLADDGVSTTGVTTRDGGDPVSRS